MVTPPLGAGGAELCGIGVPGLAVLYGISATGQRLSAHQMTELRRRIDKLVEGLETGDHTPDT